MSNEDTRARRIGAINNLYAAKHAADLATIRAIGEEFTELRATFPQPPHRAKKGEGFNAYVDSHATDKKGVGSRQAKNYMAAYQNILELGSRVDFTGLSVRKIATYREAA